MVTRIGSNYNLILMDVNIKRARAAHSKAIEPLASGQRLNHLRDDPSKISEYFRLQNSLKRKDQYQLNINTAQTRVNLTDATLNDATDIMNQVYELALQGNDESLNATQIAAVTGRLTDLYNEMIEIANTKVGDAYLFAGYLSDTQPFSVNAGAPPPMQFDGDTNAVEIQVSDTRNIQVSLNGDYYFTGDADGTSSTTDVFHTINQLITNITNRDEAAIATRLTDVQTVLEQFADARASLGNSMQQLESAKGSLEVLKLAESERISVLSETDLAEATSDLSYKEYVLETAFAVSRRIMEVSLSSFFK